MLVFNNLTDQATLGFKLPNIGQDMVILYTVLSSQEQKARTMFVIAAMDAFPMSTPQGAYAGGTAYSVYSRRLELPERDLLLKNS